MKTINDIIASVTGHQLIQELTQRMATLEPDFPELEEKYQAAVRCLKESCDENLAGSVDNYNFAIRFASLSSVHSDFFRNSYLVMKVFNTRSKGDNLLIAIEIGRGII